MGKEMQRVNAEPKFQRYSKEFMLAAVKLLQSDTKPAILIALQMVSSINCVASAIGKVQCHPKISRVVSLDDLNHASCSNSISLGNEKWHCISRRSSPASTD